MKAKDLSVGMIVAAPNDSKHYREESDRLMPYMIIDTEAKWGKAHHRWHQQESESGIFKSVRNTSQVAAAWQDEEGRWHPTVLRLSKIAGPFHEVKAARVKQEKDNADAHAKLAAERTARLRKNEAQRLRVFARLSADSRVPLNWGERSAGLHPGIVCRDGKVTMSLDVLERLVGVMYQSAINYHPTGYVHVVMQHEASAGGGGVPLPAPVEYSGTLDGFLAEYGDHLNDVEAEAVAKLRQYETLVLPRSMYSDDGLYPKLGRQQLFTIRCVTEQETKKSA